MHNCGETAIPFAADSEEPVVLLFKEVRNCVETVALFAGSGALVGDSLSLCALDAVASLMSSPGRTSGGRICESLWASEVSTPSTTV